MCPKSGKRCSGDCSDHEVYMSCNGTEIIPGQGISPIHLQLQGAEWFKVTKVEEIFEIFDKVGDVSYRIVAGNTGQGKERLICPYLFISLVTFSIFVPFPVVYNRPNREHKRMLRNVLCTDISVCSRCSC
jgi:hypothetical protein